MSTGYEQQEAVQEAAPFGAIELLGRDDILNASDIAYEFVQVPEWSNGRTATVRIKAMTGSERDRWEASLMKGTGKNRDVNMEDARAKLAALTIVDMEGTPIFTLADVKALGKRSAAALDRVYEVSARLSKISKEDVDELVGNSEDGPGEDS